MRDEFTYYIVKARERRKDGGLTTDDLRDLWAAQKGKCAYTGIELKLYDYNENDLRFLASLDRIDSALPYQRDNVHFVSGVMNLAKRSMKHEQMLEFVQMMIKGDATEN